MKTALAALAALFAAHAFAQTRDVPAKALPVPDTVSPQIQKLIGAPLSPTYNQIPACKAATSSANRKNMAICASAAGANLPLPWVRRARGEGLPRPAAIAPGTPMSDLTGAGDSFQTNAMVDNVLVAYGANCDKRAALYTAGRDLKDPMLSPVYGDMKGFPPTILTTGTRDLLLSNTARVHRKLRQAGVEASLQVFEGQSHAYYYRDVTAPESKEAFTEIAQFFDRHLGK